MKAKEFPYADLDPSSPQAGLLPYLPLKLTSGRRSVPTKGLLDTGASVNVMPYSLGVRLGVRWEEHRVRLPLTGNLAQRDARAIAAMAKVSQFPAVQLAFAWTESDDVPLILGQVNFFMEFDVCFFRSRSLFNIRPKKEKG
jgi:hypothetical protein